MRNVKTIKNFPKPITSSGAYWNKKLGLISFVNDEGETILTVQDKNMFQINYPIYYKIQGDTTIYSSVEYSQTINVPSSAIKGGSNANAYQYNEDYYLSKNLIQQGITIPNGYHVFRDTDCNVMLCQYYEIESSPSRKYWVTDGLGRLNDGRCSILVDGPADVDFCRTAWTKGSDPRIALRAYPNGGTAYIRLVKDEVVIPTTYSDWEFLTGRSNGIGDIPYNNVINYSFDIALNSNTPGIALIPGYSDGATITIDGIVSNTGGWYSTWKGVTISTSLFTFPSGIYGNTFMCKYEALNSSNKVVTTGIGTPNDVSTLTDLERVKLINPNSSLTNIYINTCKDTVTKLRVTLYLYA